MPVFTFSDRKRQSITFLDKGGVKKVKDFKKSFDYLDHMLEKGEVRVGIAEFRILASHYYDKADFIKKLIDHGSNGFGIHDDKLDYEYWHYKKLADHYLKVLDNISSYDVSYETKKADHYDYLD